MPDFRNSRRARRQNWFGMKKYVKAVLSLPGAHLPMRVLAPQVPAVRVGRLPAPRRVREVHGEAGGARYVLVDPHRCEIAKELYWGKGRRPDAADALALEVVVTLAKEARTFFDIGAYTGAFTMAVAAANPAVRAHAFEIVPAVARGLARNIARNDAARQVQLHTVGVGRAGTTMRVPSGDGESALPSFYSAAMEFEEGIEVDFVAWDEFTEDTRGPVVAKIDVEGGEETLLRHAQRFLAAHRPDILCEVLTTADGAALQSLLARHGLRFYAVGEEALHPRSQIVPHVAHRDWLFTVRAPEQLRALGIPVAP